MIAAQRLDRGLEAQPHLGLVELDPARPLAGLVELPFSAATRRRRMLVEARRRCRAPRRSGGGGSRASSACRTSIVRAVALDERRRAGRSRRCGARRRRASLGRLGARLGVGGEAPLGLGQPPLEELLALVQAGVAHLQVLALRREHGAPARRARRAARRGRVAASASAASSASSAGTSASSSAMRARSRSMRSSASASARVGGLELGDATRGARPARGPAPSDAGGERGVVRDRAGGSARCSCWRAACSSVACRCARLLATRQLGLGALSRRSLRLVERGAGGPAAGGAEAPAGRAEAVAVGGDDDGCRDAASARSTASCHESTRTAWPSSASSSRSTPARAAAHVRANGLAAGRPAAGMAAARRSRGRAPRRATFEPRSDCERATAGVGRVDDDREQRLAERGLDRRLPAVVDLDEVEQRAEHAVDAGEVLGAGAGAGDSEREVQRLGAGRPARQLLGRRPAGRAPRASAAASAAMPARLGGLDRRRRAAPRSASDCSHSAAEALDLARRAARPARAATATRLSLPAQLGLGARRARSASSAARRGPRRRRWPPTTLAVTSFDRGEHRPRGARRSDSSSRRERRRPRDRCRRARGDLVELVAQAGGVGLEVGDDAGVHQLAAVALQRAAPLDEHRGDAAGPLAELLDAHHLVAEVGVAARRQLGLGRQHRGVERGELGADRLLGRWRLRASRSAQRGRAACAAPAISRPATNICSASSSATSVAVARGGIGLALERAQLAADLAQQVLHAQQARLGGVEPALGLLLAPAVLEHAGRLLDDRAAVLGAGVQHRVDLALADDHVLLAADAGVAEQLLHVEQPAVDAVDRVLAVAGAEQRAR